MADRPDTDVLTGQLREMAETKRSVVDAQQLPGDDRYSDAFLLEAAATALDRLSEYEHALREIVDRPMFTEDIVAIARAALSGSAGETCACCAAPWPCDMAGLYPHRKRRKRA